MKKKPPSPEPDSFYFHTLPFSHPKNSNYFTNPSLNTGGYESTYALIGALSLLIHSLSSLIL